LRSKLAEKINKDVELKKILLLCEEKESFIQELKQKLQRQHETISKLETEMSYVKG
jgi:hypothetical protein